jgi:inosine-uridine nucleoside N-ribohydrolase
MKRKEGTFRSERPKKIIIDCDPGGDDAQALILAIHLAKKFGI